jgi:hypothetical protein
MPNISRGDISFKNISMQNMPDFQNVEPSGQLNFDMHHAMIRQASETEIEITFSGDTKFYFSHANQTQATVWFEALKSHILASKGLSNLKPQSHFDKF